MLILIVAGGPDKGRVYELTGEHPVVLGREGDQVRLDDRKTSRKHIRLTCEGGKWYVRDLGSRHGTQLNHQRIDSSKKVEIDDGDHIQVGNTLLVLARLSAEQTERAALVAAATADATGPNRGALAILGKRPRLTLGVAAAATALLIGANAALFLASTDQVRKLRQDNQQVLSKLRRTTAARANAATRERDPRLDKILAAVRAQQAQGKTLQQIQQALARQPQATALFKQVLAKLDKQPDANQALKTVLAKIEALPHADAKMLDEVRAMTDSVRDQQASLASRTEQNSSLLKQTLTAVKKQPDLNQVASALRESAKTADAGNRVVLQQVLRNLDEQKSLARQVAQLQKLVARQSKSTRAALAKAVANLPRGNDQKVLAAIADLRKQLPPDVSDKLSQVMAKLDKAGSPHQFAATVRHILEQQQSPIDAGLRTLAAKLDAQPTREEMQNTVSKAAAHTNAQVMGRLDKVSGQVRSDVEQLAQSRKKDSSQQQMLHEILAVVNKRTDADQKIAEIHDMLKTWPRQTRTMLKQMLAAVDKHAEHPENPALDHVLGDIKQQAMARIDEMNQAIRSDVKAGLKKNSGATRRRATAVNFQPAQAGDSGNQPMTPRRAKQRGGEASGRVPELSKVQKAYKLAFQTGQPVSIGGGVLNSKTGEVSQGRTLDPQAAKAAGIKSWREWYLADDFAERMRMQKQAMRFTGDHRSDAISLPPSRATHQASTASASAAPDAVSVNAYADIAPTPHTSSRTHQNKPRHDSGQ